MPGNTVKVTLLADAKGFQKGMRTAEDATSGFEKKASAFSGAVQGLFAGAAVAAVGKFVGESVQAFSELEQSTGAVEAVFGDFAGTVEKTSKGAADAFGLSAREFNESAALIGSQLKAQGFATDEAAAKTEELIGKAADLAATFGGPTSDAVAAIGAIMRGETEQIEKYGVSMKQADIEARALSMGLKGTTRELTKNDKAVAALDILYEQTADTAGQFGEEADTVAGKMQRLNARMEDAKASVGQGFGSALLAVAPLLEDAAKTVGILGTQFAYLTGAITPTESAIQQFEQHMGIAADTAQAALTIWKESGVAFTDLLPALDLSTTELVKLTKADDAFLQSLGMTLPEIEEMRDLVGTELVRATEDARTHGIGPLTDAEAELGGTTEDTTSAMRAQFDLIDGRLDVFGRYTGAVDDQAAAQQAVNDAIDEFGEGSPEHLEAIEDLAAANRDVRDAEIAVVDAGGLTRQEFIKQQTELGLTFEDAQRLANKYDELFTPREVTHTIRTREITSHEVRSSSGRQHGGPVQRGRPYLVGEAGPEVIVPAAAGNVRPLHPAGSPGGVPTFNITINAGLGTDPNAISRALVEALQRYERANGPIPVRTR